MVSWLIVGSEGEVTSQGSPLQFGNTQGLQLVRVELGLGLVGSGLRVSRGMVSLAVCHREGAFLHEVDHHLGVGHMHLRGRYRSRFRVIL